MAESTRRIARDVTIFTIGGTSIIGTLRTASLTITTDEIDVSAASDSWQTIRPGRSRYQLTGDKLIVTNPVFHDMHIQRAQVAWSANIDGKTRYGSGFITNTGSDMPEDGVVPETFQLTGDGTIS